MFDAKWMHRSLSLYSIADFFTQQKIYIYFFTLDGKPDSPLNFSMFTIILCGRGRCSLIMVIIVLVSSNGSNYPRLLDLQGWRLPELWTHQTSALQTPTTRQTHRKAVINQSIHPSFHFPSREGMRRSEVNEKNKAVSHHTAEVCWTAFHQTLR